MPCICCIEDEDNFEKIASCVENPEKLCSLCLIKYAAVCSYCWQDIENFNTTALCISKGHLFCSTCTTKFSAVCLGNLKEMQCKIDDCNSMMSNITLDRSINDE